MAEAYARFLRGKGQLFGILGIGLHDAKRHVASSEVASRCLGVLGASPQKNIFKWCNFVRFEGYFQPLS